MHDEVARRGAHEQDVDAGGESLTVRRAFGEAYERDGCLVIPVAWVAGGGGGGSGHGEEGKGEGGGGGFGGVAWPLGVYVVRDGTVKWVPAIDVGRLVLAAAGMLRAVIRARRRARS